MKRLYLWMACLLIPTLIYAVGGGDDTTRPTVTAIEPASNASIDIFTDTILVRFSESMDVDSLNTNTIRLMRGTSQVPASLSYNEAAPSVVITLNSALEFSTQYSVIVTTGVMDEAGNYMASKHTSSFTTVANPQERIPKVSPYSKPGVTDNYCLADVKRAFLGLPDDKEGVPYTVRLQMTEDELEPTSFHHFQGFGRVHSADNQFAYFVGALSLDYDGDLVLWKHRHNGTTGALGQSEGPEKDDAAVYWGGFVPTYSKRGMVGAPYNHPSGLQTIGKYALIPADNWCGPHAHPPLTGGSTVACYDTVPQNVLHLWDLGDPYHPRLAKTLWTDPTLNGLGGGITRMKDGRYLAMMGLPNDDGRVIFLKSKGTDLEGEWLTAPYWSWKNGDPNFVSGGEGVWKKKQNFNLLSQCDGKTFLMVFDNNNAIGTGKDEIYLYQVDMTDNDSSSDTGIIKLTDGQYRHMNCGGDFYTNNGYCNFKASGTSYVTDNGQLLIYGTGHDNTGNRYPGDEQAGMKFMEWASTTEGYVSGNRSCGKGTGRTAWLELYEHDSFGGKMVLQNYSATKVNASALTTFASSSFGKNASSLKWCAPLNCKIRVYKKSEESKNRDLEGNSSFSSLENVFWLKNGQQAYDYILGVQKGTDWMNDDLENVEFFGESCGLK
ncbi:MAG: Ig-like domain-containing protein [SAR324 cluster bacterium]|nr:Ig-like domain-containing protein [SAR324 cluster bacterium]